MPYNYQEKKPYVFTEDGQVQFLSIRDRVFGKIKYAGAVSMERAISGESGSTWNMMACVDRLVDLGEIVELKTDGCAQDRIFVKAR